MNNLLKVLRPVWRRATTLERAAVIMITIILLPVLLLFWVSYQLFRLELMIEDWIDEQKAD